MPLIGLPRSFKIASTVTADNEGSPTTLKSPSGMLCEAAFTGDRNRTSCVWKFKPNTKAMKTTSKPHCVNLLRYILFSLMSRDQRLILHSSRNHDRSTSIDCNIQM